MEQHNIKLQMGKERLAKHDLEMQHTSCKSSHTEEAIPCTSHIASSHKHTSSTKHTTHKFKSNIPPSTHVHTAI